MGDSGTRTPQARGGETPRRVPPRLVLGLVATLLGVLLLVPGTGTADTNPTAAVAPTITTQVSTAGFRPGGSVTDTATLSGDLGPVTGTVTFFVCGPSGSAPDCSSGGTQHGEPKTISDGTAVSDPFSPTEHGLYCFRAEYTPESHAGPYSPGSHTNLTTECFTVFLAPGQLEVVKSLPSGTGTFDLFIKRGETTVASALNVGNGGTTGKQSLGAGTYQVGETAAQGTDLGNYEPSIECRADDGTGAVVASGTGPGPLDVPVADGDVTKCTITNALKAPPHVIVHKLCPHGRAVATDRFQLTNALHPLEVVLDCGETAQIELVPGEAYAIGEMGAGTPPANLANYTTTLSEGCSGSLGLGETADCTITNDAHPGTIEVVKKLVPTSDSGKFNLQIDGATKAANVGNNGTTGPVSFDPGDHTVGETAGTGTSLGDYTAAIDCKVAGITIASGAGFGPLHVQLASNVNVVCTITNTRTTTPPPPPPPPPPVTPTGTIEVVKSLAPGSDAGRFDLQIDGVTKASGVGNGGSTGKVTVLTGAHSVGELAAAGTSLGEYGSSVQCRQDSTVLASGSGTGLSVTVTQNANVVCTITNVRKAVDIQITKRVSAASVHVGDRITYTLVVTNNGPGTATGVTVSDPLPAEIDFVSVTTTQGSCSGGRVVSCDLGTIPAGGSVTITVVGTAATSAKPATNRAVTVAREPESNTANNSAIADIDILGVILPPTCFSTTIVKPKDLKVGKRATIVVTVRERKKAVAGVKVRIRGAGLDKTGVTDKRGVARITVTPPTNGIVRITVPSHKTCTRPQIGVIGVITPPVAG